MVCIYATFKVELTFFLYNFLRQMFPCHLLQTLRRLLRLILALQHLFGDILHLQVYFILEIDSFSQGKHVIKVEWEVILVVILVKIVIIDLFKLIKGSFLLIDLLFIIKLLQTLLNSLVTPPKELIEVYFMELGFLLREEF